jgi:hypothetical protein
MRKVSLIFFSFVLIALLAGCDLIKKDPAPFGNTEMEFDASLIKQSYKPGERFQLEVTVNSGGTESIERYSLIRTYNQPGKSFGIGVDQDQLEEFILNPPAKSFTHTIDYTVEDRPAGTSIKFFFQYAGGAFSGETSNFIEIIVQP